MTARTLEQLAESFALFDNWEDKYRYLIDLGQRLAPLREQDRLDDNLVKGCTSRAWLVARREGGRLYFSADSDAQIVKGLIYLLMVAYDGGTPDEITTLDIHKAFEKLGLHQHLSPNRRNGFFAMVETIKSFAAAQSAEAPAGGGLTPARETIP